MRSIADVPSRSLLSRLTDHYMQIIANRAPVGFEAEFVNQRSVNICYRGILMPFSSDGETIDFIYGVINWKAADEDLEAPAPLAAELPHAPSNALPDAGEPEQALLLDQSLAIPATDEEPAAPAPHFAWQDGPLADRDPMIRSRLRSSSTTDAGLADRLSVARESADAVKGGEARTRTALYRALVLAYDFAIAAQARSGGLCRAARGIRREGAGPRADDAGREARLRCRLRQGSAHRVRGRPVLCAPAGCRRRRAFEHFIAKQPGGLKALVAAEREARRPAGEARDAGPTKRGRSCARLRRCRSMRLACDDEFGARDRCAAVADGGYEPVAMVEDSALVERAIRRAA